VGDCLVTALHDGFLDAALELVTGISREETEALQQAAFRPEPPRLTFACFLIRTPARTVMVDTGGTKAMMPDSGKMPEALAACGVDPGEVDTLLLTHLHPDHCGGMTDAAGAARFPNAEVVLHVDEAAFWLPESMLASAPEAMRPYIACAQGAVKPYAGRVRQVRLGEVLTGISAVPLPGHTPGHTGWRLTSGGESLLIFGDVVHMPAVQFARPEAGVGFDADGTRAAQTRKAILAEVAAERTLIAGIHLDFPCFGHVAAAGAGYRFVAEPFNSGI
jgi:glyoxylase-like metal-dependent hydrolase (beta-lactamase superfamily II)